MAAPSCAGVERASPSADRIGPRRRPQRPDLVFVSGQGPFDPASGAIVGETIRDETRQALTNCEAILQAAGSSMAKVVNASFILRDGADFAGMNEEWVRWFPTDPPARQGAKHALDVEGLRISIALVAEA
jgi:2-iminobutanoate/2-iminopropanoate deaminase